MAAVGSVDYHSNTRSDDGDAGVVAVALQEPGDDQPRDHAARWGDDGLDTSGATSGASAGASASAGPADVPLGDLPVSRRAGRAVLDQLRDAHAAASAQHAAMLGLVADLVDETAAS
ncbi:hypothetical protein, partial [Pseudokineococcus lusitanus]